MDILLHVCCANCAIIPVRRLRESGHRPVGYFFNPNIHPFQEFRRRLETVHEYARLVDLEVVVREEYLLEDFLAAVAPEPAGRCAFCYRSRLEQTARHAADRGYDAFTTTLLYSRYQQHDLIRAEGEALARAYGVPFIYEDYRSGWRQGIDFSRAMGLYRQQYCGCIYSERDRYAPGPSR